MVSSHMSSNYNWCVALQETGIKSSLDLRRASGSLFDQGKYELVDISAVVFCEVAIFLSKYLIFFTTHNHVGTAVV